MKKLTIFLFLIIGLIGCGNSSSKNVNSNQETEAKVKNISTKEIRATFTKIELINRKKYFELLDNQEDLNLLVSQSNSSLLSNDTNISKESIDFNKYNILVYFTKYNARGQIDEYTEDITLENSNSVKIEQRFTGHLKAEEDYFGRAIQVRIYKIEKLIKNITMIHEDEVTEINIDTLNISNEKVINFFTGSSHTYIEKKIIKVFDTNSSYQNFLKNEYNATKLLNEDIDFNKNRILILSNVYGSLGHIYQIEELITFPDISKAKIERKLIRPKDMYGDAGSSAIESIIKVYKVSRDISSIEVKHWRENTIEVYMDEVDE